MAPDQVSNENEAYVRSLIYTQKPKRGKLYHKGDLVRMSKKKKAFEKSYLPNFTVVDFKVEKVFAGRRPHAYVIGDLSSETIEGKFSPEQLQKVIKDRNALWKIEKSTTSPHHKTQ